MDRRIAPYNPAVWAAWLQWFNEWIASLIWGLWYPMNLKFCMSYVINGLNKMNGLDCIGCIANMWLLHIQLATQDLCSDHIGQMYEYSTSSVIWFWEPTIWNVRILYLTEHIKVKSVLSSYTWLWHVKWVHMHYTLTTCAPSRHSFAIWTIYLTHSMDKIIHTNYKK